VELNKVIMYGLADCFKFDFPSGWLEQMSRWD